VKIVIGPRSGLDAKSIATLTLADRARRTVTALPSSGAVVLMEALDFVHETIEPHNPISAATGRATVRCRGRAWESGCGRLVVRATLGCPTPLAEKAAR